MDILISILEKFGAWGLAFLVVIYIIINSKISIQYPVGNKDKK